MQNLKEVRAFRLDRGLLQTLLVSAKRHGISENALAEAILARYLKVDPLREPFDYICVGRETFTLILGMTDANGLEIAGAEQGKRAYSLAKELYESNGTSLGFRRYVVEILGEEAHWFRTEGAFVKPERITLHHRYGNKWSKFLRTYMSSAYEAISRDKLELTATDRYITLRLPEVE
jgi:hypothetical protein